MVLTVANGSVLPLQDGTTPATTSTTHQLVIAVTESNATYIICIFGDNELTTKDSMLVCFVNLPFTFIF